MVKCKAEWQVASDKWQVSGRKAPIIIANAVLKSLLHYSLLLLN